MVQTFRVPLTVKDSTRIEWCVCGREEGFLYSQRAKSVWLHFFLRIELAHTETQLLPEVRSGQVASRLRMLLFGQQT